MGASMRRVGLAVMLVVALALAGCSLTGAGVAGPVAIDKDDNGKTIALSVGQTLLVSLPANPSTGYDWTVTGALPPQLRASADSFDASGTPGVVGAGGTQVLSYDVVRAGSGRLALGYARPWEKGVSPVATFTVTVSAK